MCSGTVPGWPRLRSLLQQLCRRGASIATSPKRALPTNNASARLNYRHNSPGSKRAGPGLTIASCRARHRRAKYQGRSTVLRMLGMAPTRSAINRASEPRYDIEGLIAAIDGVPRVTDPVAIRRRSRDFFWYSPILNEQLAGKSADILVAPRDESDVVRVAAACARLRIPLTVRAGGTGNYGQAVPLEGGVLLDINGLNAVE